MVGRKKGQKMGRGDWGQGRAASLVPGLQASAAGILLASSWV